MASSIGAIMGIARRCVTNPDAEPRWNCYSTDTSAGSANFSPATITGIPKTSENLFGFWSVE
jgi:hypothetical protein